MAAAKEPYLQPHPDEERSPLGASENLPSCHCIALTFSLL